MQWGAWVFNPKNYTLGHATEGYEIDLDEINSSAAMLDWIFQILGKKWATAKVMHDLLQALDDILGPQANYCSQE